MTISDDGRAFPDAERDKCSRGFYGLDASRYASGNGPGLARVGAIADLRGAKPAF